MKPIQILGAILLLSVSAHGQTSLLDQTSLVNAGRFIHLRFVDDEQNQDDTYLRAEAIDSVAIYRSEREADKEMPFKVRITTRILTSIHQNGPEAWTTVNLSYTIDCSSREEADKVAKAIVSACSDGSNEDKTAEQAGAGQPATRSQSKSEGSDKPQPEAEVRSR